MELQLKNYHTSEGVRVAFVAEGRTKLTVIHMDAGGIKARRIPKSESRYMADLDYPRRKAVRKFLSAGKRFGITKGARQLLRAA